MAPTLQLKVLTEHNVTHIMYIKMENVICDLTKANTQYLGKTNYVMSCEDLI